MVKSVEPVVSESRRMPLTIGSSSGEKSVVAASFPIAKVADTRSTSLDHSLSFDEYKSIFTSTCANIVLESLSRWSLPAKTSINHHHQKSTEEKDMLRLRLTFYETSEKRRSQVCHLGLNNDSASACFFLCQGQSQRALGIDRTEPAVKILFLGR